MGTDKKLLQGLLQLVQAAHRADIARQAAKDGGLVRSQLAIELAHAPLQLFQPLLVQRDKQDENPASIKMRTGGWRIVGRA